VTGIVLDFADLDEVVRILRKSVSSEPCWSGTRTVVNLADQIEARAKSPLIVLKDPDDMPSNHYSRLVAFLRRGGWDFTADQIEAQTRPPRIPEPKSGGLVRASLVDCAGAQLWTKFSDLGVSDWITPYGIRRKWDALIDPTLVREGLS
jgi:hypothetical protein